MSGFAELLLSDPHALPQSLVEVQSRAGAEEAGDHEADKFRIGRMWL
jgi:hypothetical protein